METMMIGSGFGGVGGLFWIIVLGLIIWVVVDRKPSIIGSAHTPEKSALDILNEAYASGALDRETYMQKKTDLSN